MLLIALSSYRSSANSCVESAFGSLQRDSVGENANVIPWDHNDSEEKCGAFVDHSIVAVSAERMMESYGIFFKLTFAFFFG